jgi:hypothetical protein
MRSGLGPVSREIGKVWLINPPTFPICGNQELDAVYD